MEPNNKSIMLPFDLATKTDISKVLGELEEIDNFLRNGLVRQPGSAMQLPKQSKVFDEIVRVNNLNMLQTNDRELLRLSLKWIRQKAPMLHFSFSSNPSSRFIHELTIWLRKNISPLVLIQVGLQPNIGAGCILRTNNKIFDLSLRERFLDQKELLIDQLKNQDKTQPISLEQKVVS